MSDRVVVRDERELGQMAKQIARAIHGGDVLGLTGPLGAGKTTFTQWLARELGVTEKVTSPSYTVVTEYGVAGAGRKISQLIHVDLYRLAPEMVASEGAVQEVLASQQETGRVTVIEWADRLGEIDRPGWWWIDLAYGETRLGRIITVESWPTGRNWR